jgi:eukaryotic-like serine/threonine-protein kinase
MSLVIESQAEILPGYRLLSKLGSGGYGEVWKCEAPGGLLKAIKIIFPDHESEQGKVQRSEQELTALRRVQAVRHPYLLSLERYDIVDGRLVIVTELADCNLWDRFTEYRQLRQAGIPRDDLLRYMLEAAEVLDLMNSQYQLQHLDIKPQNLFVVHDHVKVADFGLVRDLDGVKRAAMTGATPVYAAPETYEGLISPYCDQYSLAIVYQELLTGKRPFPATNVQQLITQHMQAPPDLNSLPPSDRPPVARALAKRPEDRHASCRDFVRGLMAGGSAVTPPPSGSLQTTVQALPTVVPSPDAVLDPLPWPSNTPATAVLLQRAEEAQKAELEPAPCRSAPSEQQGDGVLFPSLVIGLGQLGGSVLQKVKAAITDRIGPMDRVPMMKLLFIDTDPESTLKAAEEESACPLAAEEIFSVRLNRPAHYLKPRRNGRSILETWFDPQILYRIKAGNPLTQGFRALGRLAFCDHYRALEQKLKSDLEAVTHPDSMDHAEMNSQLSMRTNRPRVYIVAGLGGGTGSGMFIDVAYAVRQQLRILGYDQPEVVGVFLLPAHSGPTARPQSVGNTFAALTELNHFSLPGVTYTANIDDQDLTLVDDGPPFSRFQLLPVRPPRTQTTDLPGVGKAAEYLWRDMITPFGRAADISRDELRAMPGVTPDPMVVAGQTFGIQTLSWPKRQLADGIARRLCRQILESWASMETKHLLQPVADWAQKQWLTEKLNPESMVGLIQQAGDQAVGESAEKYLTDLAEPFAPRSRWSRGAYDSASAFQALSKAVQLLGAPGDIGTSRQPGRIEQALAARTESLMTECSDKVGKMAGCLVEQPEFRLAGAEVAVQSLIKLVEQVLQHFEPQLRERSEHAERALPVVQSLIESDTRRKAGAEIAEALKQFAISRYHFLLGRSVVSIYGALRDQLGDALKQIALCRSRLVEAIERLNPAVSPSTSSGSLLPEGCKTLEDAVCLYRDSIDPYALKELEALMQTAVEQQFTTLARVCLTSTDVRQKMESALLQVASKFVEQRLGAVDVAELFMHRYRDPDQAQKKILRTFTSAEPWLEAPDTPEDVAELIAVPEGAASQAFLALIAACLPKSNPSIAPSPDDVVFYREQVTVPLRCLPHLGNAGRSAYQQLLLQQFPPHTRVDIRQWYEPA